MNSINYNKELTANTVVSKQATNVYLEASSPDATTEDKGGKDIKWKWMMHSYGLRDFRFHP